MYSKTNATDSYCVSVFVYQCRMCVCVCVCLFTMGVKSYKYYVG